MPKYVFTRAVPFGDGLSTPGDVYEPEPGRNLHVMLSGGDLVEIPDVALSPEEREAMAQKKPAAGGTDPAPSQVEREQQAGMRGIVTANPPVPDVEEAAAGVQDLDHAGTGAPTREDAGALAERQKPYQDAATEPPRPLDADEQVKQGIAPATQPDQQIEQARQQAPGDLQRAESARPVTPEDREADEASAPARDAAKPADQAGAAIVGPGDAPEPEEEKEGDEKPRGGRKGRK